MSLTMFSTLEDELSLRMLLSTGSVKVVAICEKTELTKSIGVVDAMMAHYISVGRTKAGSSGGNEAFVLHPPMFATWSMLRPTRPGVVASNDGHSLSGVRRGGGCNLLPLSRMMLYWSQILGAFAKMHKRNFDLF